MKRSTAYLIGAALVALSMTACAATGPAYQPTSTTPKSANIVVYKTQVYGNAVSFTYNDAPCKVQAKGYVTLIVPANQRVTLRHRSIGDPSPSVLTLTPSSGQRIFVRVESNDAAIASGSIGGTLGGLIGGVTGQAIATDEGTFRFRIGNEDEAVTTRQSTGGCQ